MKKVSRVYRGKLLIYLELMSQGKSRADVEEAVKLLEANGFRIKRPIGIRIQKNFEIDEGLWSRVSAVIAERELVIREAIHEALEMWLDHKESRPKDGS